MKVGDVLKDIYSRPYRVTREIGAGGQGEVAEVVDTEGRTPVAKVYHSALATPEGAGRLNGLIRYNLSAHSRALCAPFVRIQGAGIVGALQPKAPGEPLEKIFERPAFGLMDALTIGAGLCRAIAVAESLGVAHGDLAATNVHVDTSGAFPEVFLIDFDNACVPGAPPPIFTGQDFYCAPEILLGTGKTSIESDRFALSILLYEIVLRRHPYSSLFQKGEAFTEYVKQLAQARWLEDPAAGDVGVVVAGIPVAVLSREVHDLFRRGLQVDPYARPEAAEWAEKLEKALSELYVCERCTKGFLNDATRFNCPTCGTAANRLVLNVNGRQIQLAGLITIVGRDEVGGNASVSRAHVVFRRHGHATYAKNVSVNGLAIQLTDTRWVEVPKGAEVCVNAGTRLRFAPGLEGSIHRQ